MSTILIRNDELSELKPLAGSLFCFGRGFGLGVSPLLSLVPVVRLNSGNYTNIFLRVKRVG